MTGFASRVPAFHVAQLNVARLRHPLDHPSNVGFVEALDPVNALADTAPGFVWRLQDDAGDATELRPWGDDVIVNLSVWESLDHLREFVFSGAHAAIMRARREFFDPWGTGPHMVLFWVPSDTLPTIDDARRALDTLAAQGPTPWAFTFATPQQPDPVTGLPSLYAAVAEAEHRAAAGAPPVVLYIDVDDFDAVNGLHGRLTADAVLAELAVRLRGGLPPTAYLARADDDEFLALAAPGCEPRALCDLLEHGVAAKPLVVRGAGEVSLRVKAVGSPWQQSAGATLEPLRSAVREQCRVLDLGATVGDAIGGTITLEGARDRV